MSVTVPTRHLLDAAHQVALLLSDQPREVGDLRTAYQHIPFEGAFGPVDLQSGETVLVAAGLAWTDGSTMHLTPAGLSIGSARADTCRELILHEFLAARRPPWLEVATATGTVRSELLPTEADENLKGALRDSHRRERLLLALGQKFDAQARADMGAAGEEFVVDLCRSTLRGSKRPELAAQVLHASLISDALGYDIISPSMSGGTRRLEVKTMGATLSQLRFYLSRHEFETGVADPSWWLVLCQRVSRNRFELVGSATAGDLEAYVPTDADQGRWQTVLIELEKGVLQPGLPLGEDENSR